MKSLSFALKIVRVSGYWSVRGRFKGIYSIYRVFAYAILIILLPLLMMEVYKERKNPNQLSFAVFILNGALTILLKNFFTAPYISDLERIKDDMDHHLNIETLTDTGRQILKKADIKVYRLTLLFIVLYSLAAGLLILLPLVVESEIRRLPGPTWFPNRTISPLYEVLYIYNVSCYFLSVCAMTGYDCLLYAFLAQVAAHYDALTQDISELSENMDSCELEADDVRHHLKCLIIQHQKICRIAGELGGIYSLPCLTHLVFGTFLICFSGLEVFAVNAQIDVYAISKLLCFLAVSTNLFVYSSFGDEISHKASFVPWAIYGIPWFGKTTKEAQSIIKIFLLKTNNHKSMTCGKLFPLQFTTYLSVVNMAYSLISLMQQVNSK